MAFIEARLLDKVSYGFQIGPRFQTNLVTRLNGFERRNADWDSFKWDGVAPYDNIRPEHYNDLLGAFVACRGRNRAFRFKNWVDYTATGESLGAAPAGTTDSVQLLRTYELFGGQYFTRSVTKPVSGTVKIYNSSDGLEVAGSVDTTTGLFTPSESWEVGNLTADFEFDIPMRFDTDYLPFTYNEWLSLKGDVKLLEVFGE